MSMGYRGVRVVSFQIWDTYVRTIFYIRLKIELLKMKIGDYQRAIVSRLFFPINKELIIAEMPPSRFFSTPFLWPL